MATLAQTQRLTQSFPHLVAAAPIVSSNKHALILFSPDRVRLRGACGAGAGGHRDGEARRVPHLRRLLAAAALRRRH